MSSTEPNAAQESAAEECDIPPVQLGPKVDMADIAEAEKDQTVS